MGRKKPASYAQLEADLSVAREMRSRADSLVNNLRDEIGEQKAGRESLKKTLDTFRSHVADFRQTFDMFARQLQRMSAEAQSETLKVALDGMANRAGIIACGLGASIQNSHHT